MANFCARQPYDEAWRPHTMVAPISLIAGVSALVVRVPWHWTVMGYPLSPPWNRFVWQSLRDMVPTMRRGCVWPVKYRCEAMSRCKSFPDFGDSLIN
eukprot:scaffold1803_cov92-Amphora_coffeaeformis.AAC.91